MYHSGMKHRSCQTLPEPCQALPGAFEGPAGLGRARQGHFGPRQGSAGLCCALGWCVVIEAFLRKRQTRVFTTVGTLEIGERLALARSFISTSCAGTPDTLQFLAKHKYRTSRFSCGSSRGSVLGAEDWMRYTNCWAARSAGSNRPTASLNTSSRIRPVYCCLRESSRSGFELPLRGNCRALPFRKEVLYTLPYQNHFYWLVFGK